MKRWELVILEDRDGAATMRGTPFLLNTETMEEAIAWIRAIYPGLIASGRGVRIVEIPPSRSAPGSPSL